MGGLARHFLNIPNRPTVLYRCGSDFACSFVRSTVSRGTVATDNIRSRYSLSRFSIVFLLVENLKSHALAGHIDPVRGPRRDETEKRIAVKAHTGEG